MIPSAIKTLGQRIVGPGPFEVALDLLSHPDRIDSFLITKHHVRLWAQNPYCDEEAGLIEEAKTISSNKEEATIAGSDEDRRNIFQMST
jgi:hypothetical protein